MSDRGQLEDDLSALYDRRDSVNANRVLLTDERAQWDKEDQVLGYLMAILLDAHQARKDTLDQTELDLDREEKSIALDLGALKNELKELQTDLGGFERHLDAVAQTINPTVKKGKKRKKK